MKTFYNRIFMLTMAIMMSLSSFAVHIYNQTVEIGGIYYSIYLDENTPPYAWTTSHDYIEYSGEITIPASITCEVDYTWSGDNKYQYSDVAFPVMYINWGTFRNCKK